MTDGKQQARAKMEAAGVSPAAVDVFAHYYDELAAGATGIVPESEIEPLTDVPSLDEVEASGVVTPEVAEAAMERTVVLKLNGGLGTSMGMTQAKSLLPVRGADTFLDVIVEQVRASRAGTGARLPLVFMNSFSTDTDTLAALAGFDDLKVDDLPLSFVQSQEPKLRVDDLTPVEWPQDPDLEWCPPGHGDLYPSLLASGILDQLVKAGFRYMHVSNSDNLGAIVDPVLAGWFASSQAPFAVEVCRRTPADLKGGHLARRTEDGRLILRESAQTAPQDMDAFTDENTHLYFNTNSLWLSLEHVSSLLHERDGVLGLPLIRNTKTVDPRNPASPEVYQIETAMGAAVEVFEGARAIEVPRERFLPVKTTNDLLLLRSDVYEREADGSLRPVAPAPAIDLDPAYYTTIGQFDERFPKGAPSLKEATSLTVRGDVTFGAGVIVRGDAAVKTGEPTTLQDGAVVGKTTDLEDGA